MAAAKKAMNAPILKKRTAAVFEKSDSKKPACTMFFHCRIHGPAHDNQDCKLQKEMLERVVEEHRHKKRKYENDKATDQAKKLGFKNKAHMRSFFVSSIMAYKKKKEMTTLHGSKCSHNEHFQVEETEDGEILGSSADLSLIHI